MAVVAAAATSLAAEVENIDRRRRRRRLCRVSPLARCHRRRARRRCFRRCCRGSLARSPARSRENDNIADFAVARLASLVGRTVGHVRREERPDRSYFCIAYGGLGKTDRCLLCDRFVVR